MSVLSRVCFRIPVLFPFVLSSSVQIAMTTHSSPQGSPLQSPLTIYTFYFPFFCSGTLCPGGVHSRGEGRRCERAATLEPQAVMRLLFKQHDAIFQGRTYAFDGERALFSLGPLPFDSPREFEVDM